MALGAKLKQDIADSFTHENGPSLPKEGYARTWIGKRIEQLSMILESDGFIAYVLDKNRKHDAQSYSHMLRVGIFFDYLTRTHRDSINTLPKKTLEVAGFVHDTGKMYIPEEILRKPGRLSDMEFEIIKCHNMLSITLLKQLEPNYPGISEISIGHHPYPRTGAERREDERRDHIFKIDFDRRECERREGERRKCSPQIEVAAKMLTICDIFDALSSPRAYKKAWGREEVRMQLEEGFKGYNEMVNHLYMCFPRNTDMKKAQSP